MEEKKKKIAQKRKYLLRFFGMNPRVKKDPDLASALTRDAIDDLSFQRVEMDYLQEEIAAEGWDEKYNNGGGQSGLKQSSAAKNYMELQKQYNATIRRLLQVRAGLGKDEPTDELLEFLKT